MVSHHGQWDVTEFGIEAVEPEAPREYLIDAKRLAKDPVSNHGIGAVRRRSNGRKAGSSRLL